MPARRAFSRGKYGAGRAAALLVLAFAMSAASAQQADALGTRLDRIERMLDNKGLLELVRQVEQLQQEVRRLRGELEEQAYTLEQVRQGQRDTYLNLDQRLGALEAGRAGALAVDPAFGTAQSEPPVSTLDAPGNVSVAGQPSEQSLALDAATAGMDSGAADAAAASFVVPGGDTAAVADDALAADAPNPFASPAPPPVFEPAPNPSRPPPAVAAAPTAPGTGEAQPTAAADPAYRDAFATLKAGRYEDAIAAFQAYLAANPGSPYADNAQYWLGEANYVMRRFEPAIVEYQKLVTNYPQSQKQSHALLKIGYSYAELGQQEQALAVLDALKARFPGSAAARLADERIQRIRGSSAAD